MSELRKSFEELGFTDDFMFGKVMEDPKLFRDIIECLLQQSIGDMKEVQTQKEYKYTSDGKTIRLDVYNEDVNGSVYDVEMENLNKKSVESHQLPKRCRFYQSAIDNDRLDKGDPYKSLPDSTIMFICTFDPFGRGLPYYTFAETCRESLDLELNDGTKKVFYNCCYEGNDIEEPIKELYEYIVSGCVKNPLTRRINKAVEKVRKNGMLRSEYIKERQALMEVREEGREEGREEERVNTERERKRAEKAEKRVAELEKLLAAK